MASADFSAPSFRRYRRPWPFRAGVEISRNKTHFFRSAGCGFTTLLRLGLGLRLASQTCPQVGLVSAFCAYPPNFASGFLHPRPHGRKLAFGYLVPPNRPIGDLHSRPCVMSCVRTVKPPRSCAAVWSAHFRFRKSGKRPSRKFCGTTFDSAAETRIAARSSYVLPMTCMPIGTFFELSATGTVTIG